MEESERKINFEGLFNEPFSVCDYIEFLNKGLKRFRAKIIGEVSEVKRATSGHVYFTLRDKDKNALIKCVVWKSQYELYGVHLKDGLEVIIGGTPGIYAPWGSLSFKVESIELVGEGNLKKAYEELKAKLDREGIFDKAKKRVIPPYPEKIGVITSTHGAVIHDFINNLGKFGFKIKIKDSRVEGQEALVDLISSVRFFRKCDIDLLVIIRGGGSFQSLMAFDNENLVRELAEFPVPVIAGIGHHQDITLCALASDAMESTPTAVANLLNRPWEKAINLVDNLSGKIIESFNQKVSIVRKEITNRIYDIFDNYGRIIAKYRELERSVILTFSKIKQSVSLMKNEISKIIPTIFMKFERLIIDFRKNLRIYEAQIEANNPTRQLKIGYSITRMNGKIVKSVHRLNVGTLLDIELSDGSVGTEVKKNNLE